MRFVGADLGYLREEVVDDVLLDNAVEEVLANEAELSVNSSQGTLDVGPALGSVVRDLGVVVVQISDGH